jgi:hypothetical protein
MAFSRRPLAAAPLTVADAAGVGPVLPDPPALLPPPPQADRHVRTRLDITARFGLIDAHSRVFGTRLDWYHRVIAKPMAEAVRINKNSEPNST